MSKEYDDYLSEHISNVQKAGEWMLSYGVVPFDKFEIRRRFGEILAKHDESKHSVEEYGPYDEYFYGDADDEDRKVIENCFNYAWLHHIHNNPHHWQYWVLHNDNGPVTLLEMPEEEVYHMIADWWSFSWKEENLNTVFDWYEEHKDKMLLHENTRRLVESTLAKIKDLIS